jgi:hypothetical protein
VFENLEGRVGSNDRLNCRLRTKKKTIKEALPEKETGSGGKCSELFNAPYVCLNGVMNLISCCCCFPKDPGLFPCYLTRKPARAWADHDHYGAEWRHDGLHKSDPFMRLLLCFSRRCTPLHPLDRNPENRVACLTSTWLGSRNKKTPAYYQNHPATANDFNKGAAEPVLEQTVVLVPRTTILAKKPC